MPKEKKIIMFSRNGVKITKTLYLDMTKRQNQADRDIIKTGYLTEVLEREAPTAPTQGHYEVTRIASRLGFWYDKKTWIPSSSGTNGVSKAAGYRMISLVTGTTRYEMVYPVSYHDVKVGTEARPWDILPGYQGMPAHFVGDLYREATKFLDTLETAPWISDKSPSWPELRKRTMTDLFGITGKPEVQPNDIKILSHGFDLKESFRKRPEK